jgi:hypothetical protein
MNAWNNLGSEIRVPRSCSLLDELFIVVAVGALMEVVR